MRAFLLLVAGAGALVAPPRVRSPGVCARRMSMDPTDEGFPSDSGLPDDPVAVVDAPPAGDVEAPSDVEDAFAASSAPDAASAPVGDADCPSDVQCGVEYPADPARVDASEGALLDRVLGLERGATAAAGDRAAVAELCGALEAMAPPFDPAALDGTWSLVYSSEPGLYRSSPFFWGFSRLLAATKAPVGVPGARGDGLAAAIYSVTDALGVFYTIGDATQTLSGCAAPGGRLVSEVELAVEPLPNAPPLGRSTMTTTAACAPTNRGLRLALEKTEVRDSTVASLPGLGFLDDLAFPTRAAFDALADALKLTPDAATVQLLATYTSENLRITRTDAGALFVHERAF